MPNYYVFHKLNVVVRKGCYMQIQSLKDECRTDNKYCILKIF